MKIVYKTDDGQEFDSVEKALSHENYLKESSKNKIKKNLSIYLANKSKLKARRGRLWRDDHDLMDMWELFQKSLPKSRFQFGDLNFTKEFLQVCQQLEQAAIQHRLDHAKLKEANEMIPKINAALKAGSEFQPDYLLRTPSKI